MIRRGLRLKLLPDRLSVCRLDPSAAVPEWAEGPGFVSITRTTDELSIVCAEARVPGGVRATPDWRLLRLEGPFDFAETGVLAAVAVPLAEAGVAILPIATFDTDYVLVTAAALTDALSALAAAGHLVTEA